MTNVSEVVSYHAPTELQIAQIGEIRKAAAVLLNAILEHCPPCADATAATRKVREAMMTANAAIVLKGAV
jgi:hypothetical protein